MSTPSLRRRALCLLALAGALTATACQASPSPAAPAAVSGSDAFGGPPAAPSAAPVIEPVVTDIAPAPSFPATAQAYAQAVVNAWKLGQVTTLGSLTTPLVQEQLLEIPQPLNDAWELLRCDGTAGSSYCLFVNADGDELTLRISHALLGQAHAATEVKLDLTEFPEDGVAYVKEFVKAWQIGNTVRMLKLSKPAVVDAVGKAPVSPTYPTPTCCGGGLLQVKVKWSTVSATFDVGTTLLGDPHAIVGYTPPSLGLKAP